MNLSKSTQWYLANHGWRPTVNPDEMLKLYDGYVATLRFSDDGHTLWLWSVWLTDSLPIRFGQCRYPEKASQDCDNAVLTLPCPV